MQTRHPTFLRTSTLLFISLLSGAPLSGRVVDDWQYRHPLPHNQSLWKVAYGAGQYVMTGNGGVITTSPDLQRWQSTFRSELDRLDGLLYANGGFLASSRTGTILMSPDGKSWTEQVSGTEKGLLSAAYGNGRYVLTGEDGTTATSTDGQNWTISDTGDDNWYFGVTYGNGLFVAASFDWEGFNTGSFAVSSDGVNWTLVNLPAGWPEYVELYDVGYGGGKFVATGYFYEAIDINTDNWGVFIATSTDGTTWTRATNGVPEVINNPSAPVYLNMARYDESQNRWLGVGDRSVLMISTDGENWIESYPLGNSTTDFFGIGFSPEGRVMVGDRGNVYFNANGSPDWERKFTGNYAQINDIGYNGSLYVATGSTIMTSSDGIDWETQLGGQPGGTLANVEYGQGRWVAASRNNTSDLPLTTSADGISWSTEATLPEGFTDCHDLAFGNGVFVALPQSGTFSVITSMDGLTWTGRNHPWFDGKMLRCYVTFGDGKFVAYNVGASSVEIATSSNGIDWTITDTGMAGPYYEAAYGAGRWVLIGSNGAVATSTDLSTWSEQVITFGAAEPVHLHGIDYGKGHWVITGRSKSIWSSEDGVNWTPAFQAEQNNATRIFQATLFDGLRFWTVGNSGDILRSEAILGPATLSILPAAQPGKVQLQVNGDPGDQWEIVASPSLTEPAWSVITTVDLPAGSASHDDAVSGNRFYLLQPPGE